MQTQVLARQVKTADLGSSGTDVPFEQAFASIVHSYLQDSAPTLLDYELGFQMLDRDEDDTKAVGVVGFKIGSQYLYAPVFFINNELKGHELLYIKNEDRFVPLKENWINYLINRRPMMLGNGVSRDSSQTGVKHPDLTRFRFPPGKIASAMPDWVQDFLPVYSAMLVNPTATLRPAPSLSDFLKRADCDSLLIMTKVAATYPSIARAIDRYHGISMLKTAWEALRSKAAQEKSLFATPVRTALTKRGSFLTPNPLQTGELKIHTRTLEQHSLLPSTLTDDQREELWKVGVLIEDDRKDSEVSKLYKTQVRASLFSPTNSGIYDILVRDAGDKLFEKCVVLYGPWVGRGSSELATVIRLSDKQWTNCNASDLFASKEYPDKEWNDWYESLSDIGTLSGTRTVLTLIGERRQAVAPFNVDVSIGSSDGAQSYKVDFHDCYSSISGPGSDNITTATRPRKKYHNVVLRIDETPGTALRAIGELLYVPKSFKKLVLKQDERPTYATEREMSTDAHIKHELSLGTVSDIQQKLVEKTAGLKIWSDSSEVEINGHRMTKLSGLAYLVSRVGLREAVAREAMQEAEKTGSASFRVKLADVYSDMLAQGPGAPGLPEPQYSEQSLAYGGAVPAITPQEMQLPVNDLITPSENAQYYDPMVDIQNWQSTQEAAGGDNQQDVFDTAAIGSLLRISRSNDMIDEHIPGLMDGLDRVCRLLFLFYAHGDKYEDRYGEEEMPELEDSLKTTVDNLGDLCLYLKQKTIEASPEDNFDVSLDGITAE